MEVIILKNDELILILDFGGQYNQLIARRVRECNVYSEVVPYNISIEEIQAKNPKGIIFTGGPASVYEKVAPKCSEEIFKMGIPILGICYGMQLMTNLLSGKVKRAEKREYGVVDVCLDNSSLIFKNFENIVSTISTSSEDEDDFLSQYEKVLKKSHR